MTSEQLFRSFVYYIFALDAAVLVLVLMQLQPELLTSRMTKSFPPDRCGCLCSVVSGGHRLQHPANEAPQIR